VEKKAIIFFENCIGSEDHGLSSLVLPSHSHLNLNAHPNLRLEMPRLPSYNVFLWHRMVNPLIVPIIRISYYFLFTKSYEKHEHE
jgi:hypothetical protein